VAMPVMRVVIVRILRCSGIHQFILRTRERCENLQWELVLFELSIARWNRMKSLSQVRDTFNVTGIWAAEDGIFFFF
jgi:hypothetical protein